MRTWTRHTHRCQTWLRACVMTAWELIRAWNPGKILTYRSCWNDSMVFLRSCFLMKLSCRLTLFSSCFTSWYSFSDVLKSWTCFLFISWYSSRSENEEVFKIPNISYVIYGYFRLIKLPFHMFWLLYKDCKAFFASSQISYYQ